MSSSVTGGDALRRVEGEVSPCVSPSVEGVLPIRGVDGSTVRWAAMDVPSIMVEEDLTKLREAYRIPEDIELILPEPNERACFPRRGCTALHLNAFVSGMRLPLHPMFRRILRAYDLAPTQVSPNGWSQMVGGMYLWFRDSFGAEMPLHVFQTIYQPRKLPRKKGGAEERVFDDPEPDLDAPSVYGIASPLPRYELPGEVVDLTKQRPKTLVPGSAEDASQRKVVEGLSRAGNKEVPGASNVIEVDDAPEVEVPLTRKRKANASGDGTGPSAADIAGPYTAGSVPPLQRTLAVNTSDEVVLEGPSKSTPTPEGGAEGPYDSKRRLRELIGVPGSRIPDEQLRNVPFYPAMGAQAVKKYFTPKWEEFSSHGAVEDDTDARAEEACRPSFEADKEHEQAMEGLKTALESARAAYEQLEADLKESDSNLLNMTKQLDNANAAQKVAAEALEVANNDKRRLLEEAKSREEEMSGLREELAKSEKGKKEAEDGKKEVEARLANAEADFVANFHNTEAYTNFADYFARVDHQEVLTAHRNDHPEFNVKNLEVRFPPPDAEGEEDS
ncbi:Uncharacterized protein Adt_28998 [Abeliophyllum distichum]|uniref:Transposase (putative) gypsy type domain-containing protein n=1 Tax=Abeliophyllum distichum TaxID=126358 RepID=A0ABD1RY38_9LAMI